MKTLPITRFNFSIFYYAAVHNNTKLSKGNACSLLLEGRKIGERRGFFPKNSASDYTLTKRALKDDTLSLLGTLSAEDNDFDLVRRLHAACPDGQFTPEIILDCFRQCASSSSSFLSVLRDELQEDTKYPYDSITVETLLLPRYNLQARIRRLDLKLLSSVRRLEHLFSEYPNLIDEREAKHLKEKLDALNAILPHENRESIENYAIAYIAAAFSVAIKYSGEDYIKKGKAGIIDPSTGQKITLFSSDELENFSDDLIQATALTPNQPNPDTPPIIPRTVLWDAGKQAWKSAVRKPATEGIIPLHCFSSGKEPDKLFPICIHPHGTDADVRLLLDALEEDGHKHCILFGQGGAGKTTALYRILQKAYDAQGKSPAPGSIPLYLDLSTAPDQNGTLYRGGVSSFIRRSVYRLIFDEEKSNAKSDETAVLDSVFTAEDALILPKIDQLLKQNNPSPAITLLLDGLNELSRLVPDDDMPPIAVMVQQEIAMMVGTCPNVKIILTGRVDDRIILGDNIARYDLCGLDDGTIRDYLSLHFPESKVNAVLTDPILLQTLRLPLFLSIFIRLKDTQQASTPGELLRIFFNEHKANLLHAQAEEIYTIQQRNQQIEQNVKKMALGRPRHRLTAEMQAFILDFILPELAWRMGERLWINISDMEKAVTAILSDRSETSVRGYAGTVAFKQYCDPYNPEKHTDHIAEALESLGINQRNMLNTRTLTDKIIAYCVSTLGILEKDGLKFRFVHQTFRDYFASVKVTNTFKIAAAAWEIAQTQWDEEKSLTQQAAFACLFGVLGKAPLRTALRRMIGESLGEHRNIPLFRDGRWIAPPRAEDDPRRLCEQMLTLCRGKTEDTVGYTVFNLIKILGDGRGKDLSGLDLSALDLRRCSLNGIRLSRPGLAARFDGARLDRESLFPTGHNSFITSIAYHPNPDSHTLLSASLDGTAKLWDTRTGGCIGTLRGHTDVVLSAVYHPQNPNLALTASADGTAKIWDCRMPDLKCVHTLEVCANSSTNMSAAYNSDGTIIASSGNTSIKLWHRSTEGNGEFVCFKTLEEHSALIRHLQFHPRNNQLLVVCENNCIKIWSWTSDQYTSIDKTFDEDEEIEYAFYSPDGTKVILSQRFSYKITILDARTLTPLPNPIETSEYIRLCRYSPDGTKIVSLGADLIVWNADTHEELVRVPSIYKINYNPNLVFSPNGCFIATADSASVDIYDAKTGVHCASLTGFWKSVSSAVYNPAGDGFVMTSEDGSVKLWSADTSSTWSAYTCTGTLLQNKVPQWAAVYHPDPNVRQMLTSSQDGKIGIWDISTQVCQHDLNTDGFSSRARYNEDGSAVVIACPVNIGFAIWDYAHNELMQSTCGSAFAMARPNPQLNLNDSNNPKRSRSRYLSIDTDGEFLYIWDALISCPIRFLRASTSATPSHPLHRNKFVSAVYSHDGSMILAAQRDGIIALWDADLRTCHDSVQLQHPPVIFACFNHDSSRVIAALGNRSIRLWDVKDGKLIESSTPPLHILEARINSAVFSPDGRHMLTALSDGTCKIWDADTYQCLQTIPNIPGLFVQGVDFSTLAESTFTEEDRQHLRMYGAKIDNPT